MPIAGKQCENAQFSVTLRPAGRIRYAAAGRPDSLRRGRQAGFVTPRPAGRIRYAAAGQTGFGTLRPAGAVGSAGVDIRRGSDGRFSSQEHV
jgi:hypothetical protein